MGGYCYINNAAVAAQWFIDRGAKRVSILDVDYHHGNGTQEIFYRRNDVQVINLHGDPMMEYPFFLGHRDERGEGDGEGFNLNYPMPHGTAWDRWNEAFENACDKLVEYGPDVVVVSLGVDTFEKDPISKFKLISDDYPKIGRRIAKFGLPTLVVMEGGYAVEEIGINAVGVLTGSRKADVIDETTLGVVQFACTDSLDENVETAVRLVRAARDRGARSCWSRNSSKGFISARRRTPAHFARARPADGHPVIETFRKIARELGIVVPVSFFERANQAYFNSVAMIDDRGEVLGIYRKSHIPDGPGYSEKFYFNPGDTGFRVWRTRFGSIGVGSAGTSGFPRLPAPWRCRAPNSCSIRPRSVRSPGDPISTRWSTGGRRCAGMRRPTSCRCGREPDRHRGRGRPFAELLRVVLHRRPDRSAGRIRGQDRRSHTDRALRSPEARRRPRPPGDCSATAGRNFTVPFRPMTGILGEYRCQSEPCLSAVVTFW